MKRSPQEVLAILEDLKRKRNAPAKPKVVVSEGRAIRDADVAVSRADPNAPNATKGVVSVRRDDFVTINMRAYEDQQALREEERARDRQLDPYRLGHWGPNDD